MRDFAEIGGWKPLYLNHCQVSVVSPVVFRLVTRQPLVAGLGHSHHAISRQCVGSMGVLLRR